VGISGNDCEVAVIGTGPFGLAVAAHLKAADIATHVFGEPMSFWRDHMPERMKLRSPWAASHIAHPQGAFSLDAYAEMRGFAPQEQMPVDEFVRYGCWFQTQTVPDLDRRKVVSVEPVPRGFHLHLDDGGHLWAGRVVVATGLARQQFRPAPFAGLPAESVSHSSEHVNFDAFRGKRVAVIGRGQSACESAALLSEAGADVDLICSGRVRWLGPEQGDKRRGLAASLCNLTVTRGAVGPFPLNWLAEAPGLVHLLPADMRDRFSLRCLRPKATRWLLPRFDAVRIHPGQTVFCARGREGRVTLDLIGGSGTFDHIVLATGYRTDIAKLGILAPELLQRVAVDAGAPRLSSGMESSVHGLHFAGPAAVHSFGPLMRFVWGAGFAARSITRAVLASRALARSAVVPPERLPVFAPMPKTFTRL